MSTRICHQRCGSWYSPSGTRMKPWIHCLKFSLHWQIVISEFHRFFFFWRNEFHRFIFGILDGPVGKLPKPLSWSHHEQHDFIQDGTQRLKKRRHSSSGQSFRANLFPIKKESFRANWEMRLGCWDSVGQAGFIIHVLGQPWAFQIFIGLFSAKCMGHFTGKRILFCFLWRPYRIVSYCSACWSCHRSHTHKLYQEDYHTRSMSSSDS